MDETSAMCGELQHMPVMPAITPYGVIGDKR